MIHTPKVSVLMPAYNAEQYIWEAIDSIIAQTFTDRECIIIDDCSTDNTRNSIKKYAEKDKRIIAIKNEENLNIAANRNKLLSLAQWVYIMRQDGDDISYPDRMKLQSDYLDNHKEVGIVWGHILFFENSNPVNTRIRKYHQNDNKLRWLIFQQSPLSQWTSMVRKSIMDKIWKFDTTLWQAEDLDISFRIWEISKFANINWLLLKCRYHNTSISTKYVKNNIKDTLIVRKRYKYSKKYNRNLKSKIAYFITYWIQFLPAKFIIKLFDLLRW